MTTARARLIAAHNEAAVYYRAELLAPSAQGPRDYLARRGFPELIDTGIWTTGYAPPGWTALTGHLRTEGFTDQEILDAGLALTTHRGTIIDRFRDRLMFGIRNREGTLVGFTGRAAPSAGPDCPKYLNSPTTTIFNKSHLLFGLAEHREHLASGAVPVITEGPLDAIALHAIALDGTTAVGVATLGTALTPDHVHALITHSSRSRVITGFDADLPGTRAQERAFSLLAQQFLQVDALPIEPGKDLAQIRHEQGPGALRSLVRRSHPVVLDVIERAIRRTDAEPDNAELRLAALRAAAPLVSLAPANIAEHAHGLASGLDLDLDTVTRELSNAASPSGLLHHRPRPAQEGPPASIPPPPATTGAAAARHTRPGPPNPRHPNAIQRAIRDV
jgi:DNA primase catalytic core